MKKNRTIRGFTLIELLVVVLIVAILAAIAVPQYQKAVLKSRFSSLMPTTKSVRDGQEIYYMTHGHYADEVSKLDVTTTNTDDMTITVSGDMDYAYTMATRPSLNNNLIMYQKHSVQFPDEIHCEAKDDNSLAQRLCQSVGATRTLGHILHENYTTYILQGAGSGNAPAVMRMLAQADCTKAESMGYSCSSSVSEDRSSAVKTVCATETSGTLNMQICTTTTYNEDGSYSQQTNITGSGSINGYANSSLVYDEDGNLVSKRLWGGVGTGGTEYFYDGDNLVSERNCKSWDSSGKCSAYNTSESYDYTYENGKMSTKKECSKFKDDGVTCSQYYATYSYVYGDNDELLAEKNTYGSRVSYVYSYNPDGSLSAKRACSSFDANNNCSSYPSATSVGARPTFLYDANGRVSWVMGCSQQDTSTGACLSENVEANNIIYDDAGSPMYKVSCSKFDIATQTCINPGNHTSVVN